uniref:Ig-like domain-containing protein n=1 Tax=Amphimedon queenslandica TaxID=400682 RepID=A0A1X7T1N1_AMPQE
MSELKLLLVLLSIIFLSVDGATGTITTAAVPIYGTETFHWGADVHGDELSWYWLIDNAVLTESIAQQREITVTTITIIISSDFSLVLTALTINALPINDRLRLDFVGISPVEDIQYSFTTNNLLLITWSPPTFFSTDIPQGLPVSYQVLVTDEDGDSILNATTTNANITNPDVTECDTFDISITALLAQYTSMNNTISNNGSYAVNITINKDNFIRPNVTIELSCPPSQSNTFLTITSDSTAVIDQYTFTGTDESINDIRTLIPYHQYNYTVRVFNLRNKLQYETYTIITITVPPVSVTVPPLTTATFTCEGTGDIFNWLIDSGTLTDSIKQQRQILVTTTNSNNTNFSSVLTVNAIPANDGLGISCEVVTYNPFINRVVAK